MNSGRGNGHPLEDSASTLRESFEERVEAEEDWW